MESETRPYHGSRASLPTEASVLDGKSSSAAPVTSGVPQGTVLGPLLFLVYINDLPSRVSSSVRLFADDCLLYRVIKDHQDADLLQTDLDQLQEWERDCRCCLTQTNVNTSGSPTNARSHRPLIPSTANS